MHLSGQFSFIRTNRITYLYQFEYIPEEWFLEAGKVTNIILKNGQLQNENHNLHTIGY
jgi:hypothetical protein